MKKILRFASLLLVTLTFQAQAALIDVAYNGSFDESSIAAEGGLPAGDYDTIGGLQDVAVFQLVAGNNDFYGSIYSPSDSADVFNIEIGENLRLIGATIEWATNLPSLQLTFPTVPNGFLQQNTFFGNAPDWFLEESSTTPEVFTIYDLQAGMVGNTFDVAPSFYTAATFSREKGIYSSLLSAAGTCAQTYSTVGVGGQTGLQAFCAAGIDYKMTFIVEQIQVTPPNNVSEPAPLSVLLSAFLALALIRRKS